VIVSGILSLAWLVVQGFRVLRREWSLFLSWAIFGMALIMALSRIPT
jgi:hypothetical protein